MIAVAPRLVMAPLLARGPTGLPSPESPGEEELGRERGCAMSFTQEASGDNVPRAAARSRVRAPQWQMHMPQV